MEEPILNTHDLGSGVWTKIKQHMSARLAELREENDSSLTEIQTAKKRGHIAEVKYVLSLGDPPIRVRAAPNKDSDEGV